MNGDSVAGNDQSIRPPVRWSEPAERRLGRISAVPRKMVRERVESYARDYGYTDVTVGVYNEAQRYFGMQLDVSP